MLADAELGRLSDGNRIRADLVPQTNAMIAAAARDGVVLRATQGYRPLAEQISLFLARYVLAVLGLGPFGDVRWWAGRRYVRSTGAAAAVPGTSNHGWGQAIDWDISQAGALAWLTAHAHEYGWSRPAWTFLAVSLEPWHWEAVQVPMSGGATSTPTTTTDQEDIVATIDDLISVLRSGGVSGAGDTGRLIAALDGPTRTIVSQETTKVLRSEGVSGAGDLGRLVGALVPAIASAQPGAQPDTAALARTIAAAIPADIASQVADELAKRLAS